MPQEQAGADPRQSPAGPESDSQLSQVSWLHQVLLPPFYLRFLAELYPHGTFPGVCTDVQSLVIYLS